MYKSFFKRLLDIIGAIIALILSFPVYLVLIPVLILYFTGNPFFFQKRPGKNGVLFTIIKFKTMNDLKDDAGDLLPDNERLNKLGSFIRKTSLDELPQFINVLKGDMSLVGPRPLLVDYLPLYNKSQSMRHNVKPGITGWAQVNGRNAINWKQKFELDIWYVENISLKVDVKIMILTVKKVLFRDGINFGNSNQKFSSNI